MVENIIWIICLLGCGALFSGFGIYALRRKKPMWFWAGRQVYYLYRLSFTGVTEWKYIKADDAGKTRGHSNYLMSSLAVPDSPLNITSAQYGDVISQFDYDSTLIPGLTRYGRGKDQREVFALQWEETEYLLKIRGYLPIHISGKDIITFVQEEKEIARIVPAPAMHIEDESMEADHIKRFEIDPEYIPVLEIIGAFVALQFAF